MLPHLKRKAMLNVLNTIAAISTASGVGGIGVVRVSGPKSQDILKKICSIVAQPRQAHFVNFKNKEGDILDQGLVLFFPGPNSFTGEDVVEFQGHGGPVVLNSILNACLSLGASLALPGEFTQRAYLNNKIDLVQAESVIDLINASTEQAAKSAINSLSGNFSNKINDLLNKLIELRMYIEACLDFPEEDIDFISEGKVKEKLQALSKTMMEILSAATQGQLLRDGINIVLVGQPNVGKSSLINLLLKEDRAIVSPEEGTTRDVLEARLNLNNIPVTIYDTAGIRNTKSAVEAEGVKRAKKTAQEADIVMLLFDITKNNKELNGMDFIEDKEKIIKVYNKSDLFESVLPKNKENFIISCVRETGIEQLLERIGKRAEFLTGGKDILGPNRIRHISHLNETKQALEQALQEHTAKNYEITADFLRSASISLGRIVGIVDIEDVLDELFAGFCIGK